MKTTLTLLLLLLGVQLSYSQIKFKGYFETGLLKESISLNEITYTGAASGGLDNMIDKDKDIIIINGVRKESNVVRLKNSSCMYSEMNLSLNWKWFTLEQSLYDIFTYEGGKSFKPLEIQYTTRLYYDYKWIRIGYEHMCMHPIGNYHNVVEKVTRRASHDKLYLRLTFGNEQKRRR